MNLNVAYERERVVKDDSRFLAEKSHQKKCHLLRWRRLQEETVWRKRSEVDVLSLSCVLDVQEAVLGK